MSQFETYTEVITKERGKEIKNLLALEEFNFFEKDHAIYAARLENVTVIFYKKGKIVIQGPNIEKFLRDILGIEYPFKRGGQQKLDWDRSHWTTWIGTDESGKGDYFGPLVVAGVKMDRIDVDLLSSVGVKDSKSVSDTEIDKLSGFLKGQVSWNIVAIGPERYNDLYKNIRNVNKLLAWGHARVIENILEKVPCNYAFTDQFGDKSFVKKALMEKGKKIELYQEPKAESDVAVAAASILARSEFLSRLKGLGKKYDMTLPKGASEKVEISARKFVEKYGDDKLKKVAKLHFRTTKKVLSEHWEIRPVKRRH